MNTFNLGFTPFTTPCEYWDGRSAVTVIGFRIKNPGNLFWVTTKGRDVSAEGNPLSPLGGIKESLSREQIEAIPAIPVTERPIETMARPESRWVRASDDDIAQQDLVKANIEDKVSQKRAKKVSDPVDERHRATNRLLSRLATDGKNHAITSRSLLHGLGGDHEVLSEKVDRLQDTVHKMDVTVVLEMEAAESERKQQAAFRKRLDAFMDEFRIDA